MIGVTVEVPNSPAFAPEIVSTEITSGAVPLFVTISDCGVVVRPTNWFPKPIVDAEKLMAGAVPVPLRPIACGLPVALLARVRVADSSAAVDALNVTGTVVFAPGATEIGRAGAGKVKSAALPPATDTAEITRFAVPLLVMVRVSGALAVFLSCLPKLRAAGLAANPGAVPVPESATACGEPLALSAMFSVAARLPVAAGVNDTVTVVCEPGATVIGSVGAVEVKSAAFAPVMDNAEITRSAVPLFVTVIVTGLLADPVS